jgi:hypothetical protein
LSRDPSNFLQDGLLTLILQGIENLLYDSQKSRYLQRKIKPFEGIALYALVTTAWGLCWLLDDAMATPAAGIAPWFKVPHLNYYAFLVGFGVAVVLGSVAAWLTV